MIPGGHCCPSVLRRATIYLITLRLCRMFCFLTFVMFYVGPPYNCLPYVYVVCFVFYLLWFRRDDIIPMFFVGTTSNSINKFFLYVSSHLWLRRDDIIPMFFVGTTSNSINKFFLYVSSHLWFRGDDIIPMFFVGATSNLWLRGDNIIPMFFVGTTSNSINKFFLYVSYHLWLGGRYNPYVFRKDNK